MNNQKRYMKRVPGGVMVADDGGHLNFFPTQDVSALGACLDLGAEDYEPRQVSGLRGYLNALSARFNLGALKVMNALKIRQQRQPEVAAVELEIETPNNVIYIAEWKAKKNKMTQNATAPKGA